MYDALTDSDDMEERSQAIQWISETAQRDAENSSKPLLNLAKQIRIMLAVLILLGILALLKLG